MSNSGNSPCSCCFLSDIWSEDINYHFIFSFTTVFPPDIVFNFMLLAAVIHLTTFSWLMSLEFLFIQMQNLVVLLAFPCSVIEELSPVLPCLLHSLLHALLSASVSLHLSLSPSRTHASALLTVCCLVLAQGKCFLWSRDPVESTAQIPHLFFLAIALCHCWTE